MRPGLAVATLARRHPRHAVVAVAVLAVTIALSVAAGNHRVWPYVTVVLSALAVVAIIDRSVDFSAAVLWLMVITGALHLAGGLAPNPAGDGPLYDAWLLPRGLRFDQFVHVIGSATATFTAWELLGKWLDEHAPKTTHAWLAALAALGAGAFNEGIEFVAALRLPTNVGGFHNTGWDLVFDTVGVVTAAVVLALLNGDQTAPSQERWQLGQ